ncbi:unnamed protein product [Ectocarpus sp. 13 AM-2016]
MSNAGTQALRLAVSGQHLDIMAILTGAGVVGDGTALLEAAGLGHEASGKFLLRQPYEDNISSSVEVAFINAAGAPGGGGYTPLVCDVVSGSSQAPRVARLLMDAGADAASVFRGRNWDGELIFNDTPLAFTTSYIRRKVVAYDEPATEEHLHRLEAIRRLLLRVEAIHAVPWLWPSDSPFIGHDAEKRPSPPLRLTLPILKRQTERRGDLGATFLR